MFLGDRYEILEKIGSGGMAEVFKGKDHKLNRFVAVKVLKDEFVEDKNFVRKFKEEAQAAAGLAHPNIVNVYDVGEEMNINYIVQELVEGITLKTYIEKKGKLTVKEATSIAIQVGAGLEIAHNNHIVHRDIKPQNIMISREGKVKVTDFGIAKSVSSNTNTADTMGSVHYTSPEQARCGYSDAKSDIYSLGIVMYEMVTGRVPFDGETTVVVAVKHLQEDITSPRVYASDVPVSLEHVILKCTEKSPDRRYANVADLVADLKQSLVTPDVNFVKMIVPGGEKTVALTREEVSKIKSETGRVAVADTADSKYAYLDEEDDDDYLDEDDYDDYDEADEEEEDDEDEGGILNPRLEKIMTIGGIVAAVIIIIIIIFIIAKLFGFGKSGSNDVDDNHINIEDVLEDDELIMPNILGMSYSEAKEELNAMGLGIQLGETKSSDEYEPGQIISQSVEEGEEVEANTTIIVDICGDGEEVKVPDVAAYTKEKALETLETLGLTVDVVEQYSDDVSAGKVIGTSPKAGSKVDKSSVVNLIVSKGPEKEEGEIAVPKLIGQTEEKAKELLKNAKLASGSVKQEFSDTVEEGKVISQGVKEGTKVPEGTAISYVVSKGKEKKDVYIGNYSGMTEEDAKKKLEGKGVKVAVDYEYSDNTSKGVVTRTDPGNGSTVKSGSTVTIWVSKGKKPVETVAIPNVMGKSESDATAALTSAGFTVTVKKETVAVSSGNVGKVVAQSTGSAEKGSAVSITIGVAPDPATCTHSYSGGKCTICGATEPAPCTHPTHGTDGKCSSCGASVGHSYSSSDGKCSCGATDPNFVPAAGGDGSTDPGQSTTPPAA